MKAEELFEKAKEAGAVPQTAKMQSAFQFGVDADGLAALVLDGTKTATASAYELYEEEEPLPKEGAYDVVLDGQDEAVCVIQNDSVKLEEYLAVSEQHARAEGEGDRSLSYWRSVHEPFFEEEYKAMDKTFDKEKAQIVLESFHVVYRPERK
ncbi:ASCH domain-containing protein [Fructobacillus durionis]|uniref:Uncharacterized protein YhfF n=1 Tax=Fructobacillus durionis TaxID=283737 RepID=A0A1I1H349_9LACO|nr:ASCH domain-containing protein [Fructobacillus durionis]SFC15620.1 Uncharacterized protein YhfF [Fructobacillus durionis]